MIRLSEIRVQRPVDGVSTVELDLLDSDGDPVSFVFTGEMLFSLSTHGEDYVRAEVLVRRHPTPKGEVVVHNRPKTRFDA